MKMSKIILGFCIIIMFLFLTTNIQAQARKVNWDAFSINLVVAIKSNHPGLQKSAMQQIIRYADNLDVSDAVYDISQIFRFDDNPNVRRLAMITLSKINTDRSLGYLSQYLKFEDNEAIKKQCRCIIYDYYASESSDKNEDLRIVLSEKK